MHVDLSNASSTSLSGIASERTYTVSGGDSTTRVTFYASDTPGASSGVPLIDTANSRGNTLALRSNKIANVTDASTYVGYTYTGTAPTAVWVDGLPTSAAASQLNVYGDGSDGVGTFDGSTVVAGMTPSVNVYTMTRDLYLASATVSVGVTIATAGYRLFCAGLLTNAGTIQNNGGAGGAGVAGTGGTAGTAGAAGSCGLGGTAGGAGGSGNAAGSAGTNATSGFPNPASGAFIGAAGGTDGTNGGGAAPTYTAVVAAKGGARSLTAALAVAVTGGSTTTGLTAGAGGGGGGGNNADAGGGGGGGGGGACVVAAMTLVNSGTIQAAGGAGGLGVSTSHNAGGGGGGGGGILVVVSRSYSNTGTVAAPGGAGGAKAGSSGVAGAAGAAGVVLNLAA